MIVVATARKMLFILVIWISLGPPNVANGDQRHRQSPGRDTRTLIVGCEVPCVLAVDGNNLQLLPAKKELHLRVKKGQHVLRAISLDGKDAWEEGVSVGIRPLKTIIPLHSIRSARELREKKLETLRHDLEAKQTALASVEAQFEQAKAVSQERALRRERADKYRMSIIRYIGELETLMKHESDEVTRLKAETNLVDAPETPSSIGGLINAINNAHSKSIENGIGRHNDRINRLLGRVDSLTSELGSIRNDQEPKISVPPSSFAVSSKRAKTWDPLTLEFGSGEFALSSSPSAAAGAKSVDETIKCAQIKHVSREGKDSLLVEIGKQKTTIRMKGPQEREAAIERWFTSCPDRVNW